MPFDVRRVATGPKPDTWPQTECGGEIHGLLPSFGFEWNVPVVVAAVGKVAEINRHAVGVPTAWSPGVGRNSISRRPIGIVADHFARPAYPLASGARCFLFGAGIDNAFGNVDVQVMSHVAIRARNPVFLPTSVAPRAIRAARILSNLTSFFVQFLLHLHCSQAARPRNDAQVLSFVCLKHRHHRANAMSEFGVQVVQHFLIGKRLGPVLERLRCPTDTPFFTRQRKVVLENSGHIDPEQIDDYIAADGYTALVRALTESSPDEVLREVSESGLRGRGGGGYPSGLKWATVARSPEPVKYVICNADEGDPGAFMDRAVLESDPHRVLEGMALAAYAVGGEYGYIYIRAEYPLAVERLKRAIREATRLGLLGRHICDTPFSFEIEIRLGAGAFVCGEETALMASIEGLRGQPRPRPPYPADEGLWGCPTLINNVETLANVPTIVRESSSWFRSIGTANSTGTKVFALAGRIKNTGLIEVRDGDHTCARSSNRLEVAFPMGGNSRHVQTGGPSGGCLPEAQLRHAGRIRHAEAERVRSWDRAA